MNEWMLPGFRSHGDGMCDVVEELAEAWSSVMPVSWALRFACVCLCVKLLLPRATSHFHVYLYAPQGTCLLDNLEYFPSSPLPSSPG